MAKLFLSARWENLLLVTYKVPPDILKPHLPPALELDTIGGDTFASLVAFDFLDTKVKGLKIPFHVNFPEINLRFYVKNNQHRGVVFIKELVPRFFLALAARIIYNENYRWARMENSLIKSESISLNHTINFGGTEYSINVTAENKPYIPEQNSTEHFFKEHEWGFGTTKKGEPLIYRVEHPEWEIFPITGFSHNFDFGKIYGEKWRTLNGEKPYSIVLAKGSEVKVYGAQRL
jgi:uncharacterized protein YqjF (DUF2071 family)